MSRFAGQTFKTKTDAQVWLAHRQAELRTRTWTDPVLGRIALSDCGSQWIAEHRLADRTQDLYEGLFRLHIVPFLGRVPLDDITSEMVRGWRAGLRDKGRSESTTAKACRLLSAILNAALDDGRISKNPCRIKGADREKPAERPVASVAEVFFLADHINPRYRALVLTAALASLRWGELVALRRRDIDLVSGLLFVRRAMVERGGNLELSLPKNNKTRTVAIPTVLIDELRLHLTMVEASSDSMVFTGDRGGIPRRGNWRANVRWPALIEAAGLPPRFPFPRSAAHGQSLSGPNGSIDTGLMQRKGHSTVRGAMVYQHATDARSRELADRLDALVQEQRGADDEH